MRPDSPRSTIAAAAEGDPWGRWKARRYEDREAYLRVVVMPTIFWRHGAPEYAAYRAVRTVLHDVRDAAVDDPAVCGLFDGGRIERVLPAQSISGPELSVAFDLQRIAGTIRQRARLGDVGKGRGDRFRR
jgi:hypothetical protein